MCKAKVENVLTGLDGVESAVASLDDANVEVRYDDTKVTPEAMADAVDDAGFELVN